MSFAEAPGMPDSKVILRPYRRDPETRGHRRARRWAIGILAFFSFFWGLVFAFLAPALIVILAAPVIVLFLLTLWAMPDVSRAPSRAMGRLFLLYTSALILWPFYISISIPHSGLPWISLTRLLDVPLSILFLTSVAASKELRHQIATALGAERPIATMFILFTVIEALSIALSNRPFVSLNKWVDAQIGWTCMFFLGCFLFLQPGRVRRWVEVIWACAVITGLIAIWEWRHQHVPWLGHLPAFLQMDPLMIQQMTPSFRNYSTVYRTQSTFQSALGLGEYMSLAMPFVLHLAVSPGRKLVRAAAALTLPLIGFATFISHARSGVIGLLIGVGLYVFYWGVLQWRRHRDSPIGPAVILSYPVTAVAGLIATFVVGRLRSAVWGGGETVSSTLGRQIQYQMGLPKILSNPLGHGIGRGGETLGFFEPGGLLTIDTYYLSVALEYGVIGFIAFYGMILYSIYTAGRHALDDDNKDPEISFLAPASIALTAFFVIKSVYSEQNNHPLYFMVIGMVLALVYRLKAEKAAASEIPSAKTVQRPAPRRLAIPAHQPPRPYPS
jgi:hypothetical protein